jgi:putative transposase
MSKKYKFASPVCYRSGYEKNGAYFVSFAIVNWIGVFTRDIYLAINTDQLRNHKKTCSSLEGNEKHCLF